MSAPVTPEIIATISLLRSESGGRESAIPHGEYRGVLGIGHEHFSCRFFVSGQVGLGLGQTETYGIQFLAPDIALPRFPEGANFTLWEGKVVGTGTVQKLVWHG